MTSANGTLVRYVFDAKASRFTVQAFATGILSAMGHNPTIGIRKFSGEVNFNQETAQGSGFHLAVDATSLGVQDDISNKDRSEIERLMKEQVLETTKYPEIAYDAASVSVTRLGDSLYSARLEGQLSLHNVTCNQPVTARIAAFGNMLRASGEFIVSQSDFQIKPVSFAGGALKIKDELKLSFEIVAREQE